MTRRLFTIILLLTASVAAADALPTQDTDTGKSGPDEKRSPIAQAATPIAEALPEAPSSDKAPQTPPQAAGNVGTVDTAVTAPADTADNETVSPAAVPKDRMPVLKLEVKPAEATVGQEITWELTVKRKKEDSVHLEGGATFGGLEIKSRDRKETPAESDWVLETLTVYLIGFDPGDITIPKQKLTVVDFEGHLAEMMTPESFVTIKSLLANEPEPKLKEDTGQGEVVMEKDYLLLWIFGILAGIAVVAALTLLGRKLWAMRKPKPLPPPPPPRPAEEIANEKLETLRRSNLLAEGQIKEFHVRLSEAVREYIGNRFHFDSLEMSSEELISAVQKINLTRTEYELILDFLGETDLVKFAKALPTLKESEELLDHAFGFVVRTTPKVTVPETESKTASDAKEVDRA